MNKNILFLDLDECLIHSTTYYPYFDEEDKENPNYQEHDFKVLNDYYVYKRPDLNLFLEYVYNNFDEVNIRNNR